MRKISSIFLFLVIPFLFASCGSSPINYGQDPSPVDPVDKGYLKISRQTTGYFDTDYLFVSENGYQFLASGKTKDGKNASYTYSCTWESGDASIVSINTLGIAKAIKDGTTTIKATYQNYSDEVEVVVKTYATISALTELEDEYRTNREYSIPLYVQPQNAFVKYTFSKENAVQINEENKTFTILEEGKVTINATIYVNYDGRTKTLPFTIDAINNDRPYFKYDNKVVENLELDVPIRKYQSLDFQTLGISAYAGDTDNDISTNITLKNGTYDILSLGTYDLTLSVINNAVEAELPLVINIVERETIKTNLVSYSITVSDITLEVRSDNHTVVFTANCTIPNEYEEIEGQLGIYIQFDVKRKVSGQYVTLDYNYHKWLQKTSTKKFSVYYTNNYDIDIREGNDDMRVRISYGLLDAFGYNYIVY